MYSRLRLGAGVALSLVAGVGSIANAGSDGSGAGDTTMPDTTQPAANVDWEAIEAAAREEGTVALDSQMLEVQGEGLEAAFEEAYPEIDLVWRRISAAEAQPVIEAERESGDQRVDVYITESVQWLQQNLDEGFLSPLVGPAFSNPDFDRETYMQNEYWADSTSQVTVWAWNTEACPDWVVENGITSWEDFLNPDLKGRIMIGSDPTTALVVADIFRVIELQAPPGWLEAVAEQDPRVFAGSGDALAMLSSGEVCATNYLTSASVASAIAEGAPLAMRPWPTVWAPWLKAATFSDAPHPNAAQVLANFIFTPEGQTAFNQNSMAVLPNIPGTIEVENFERVQIPTQEDYEAFVERFAELFQ